MTEAGPKGAPTSKGYRVPSRPGHGTVGMKCMVRANHFLVQLTEKDLHHYDVAITPEVISRGVNHAVITELIKLHHQSHLGGSLLVYDGRKGLYTAGPLPFKSKEFVIKLPEKDGRASMRKDRDFKVSIQMVGRADMHHLQQFLIGRQLDMPQETIQALDVVLRQSPSNRHFSYRFLQASAAEYLFVRDASKPLSDTDCRKVKKVLRGLSVETTHVRGCKRCYRISGNQLKNDEYAAEFGMKIMDGLASLETRVLPPPMVFNPNPVLPPIVCSPRNVERELFDIHSKSTARFSERGVQGQPIQLLIVILSEASGSYGKIKRICETELGIISQCCKPKVIRKLSNQYFENVAMKINVKVGGRNMVLDDALCRRMPLVSDRPTIIFGADVTHPQPGEDYSPSIAAVVASMDWPEITKYRGLVSAQPHRQEMIEDLFTKSVDPKRGPVNGGMMRDGVSEGQFNQVLLYEMTAIRKGTSRPAHYHVLYDENCFTADALQVLTNNLCYTGVQLAFHPRIYLGIFQVLK
ncbi:Protein argonaute 1 [Acorus calamus]|uniref:Protein argonaute 1 n=1 Tax=Acorus calamus TaxID=4465 RepID=A0AAV9C2Y9_ACOCL|nr:Protein argonaute 1 [Acorus calamus]